MTPKVVNLREGKNGDFLVSYPYYNDGGVRVERFCLEEDPLFKGEYGIVRKSCGLKFRERAINLQDLRKKYPDMDDDGVKKLLLYLCARDDALKQAEGFYSGIFIDRTRGLKDLVHVDEHDREQRKIQKSWDRICNPVKRLDSALKGTGTGWAPVV